MNKTYRRITVATLLLAPASLAQAQWINFTNQTGTRMTINLPDILDDAIQLGNDAQEKDYAWGDLDRDGDIDMVCTRKRPLSFPGGKRNILFLNENGVLVDRTSTRAVDALGVPAGEGTSQGFLDNTNDRQAVLTDVNNDGWLDVVTGGTIADGIPRYLGHPRVYINKGSVAGVWQGLRYEYARIPQLLSKSNVAANPRFCSVAAGDITGDGYPDLYFVDYDTGEVGPSESSSNDMDNKLLINQGAANPGVYVDESVARMGTSVTYPNGGGTHNLLFSTFGAHGLIDDFSGDGVKDVMKITTLVPPIHIAIMTNPGTGNFGSAYKGIWNGQPYGIAAADLNNDARLDVVIVDDGNDRYALNTGNDGNGAPNFSTFSLTSQLGTEFDFNAQITVEDLDNDGRKEVMIVDEDLDTFFPGNRRTRIYRNLLGTATNTIREESPSVIPTGNLVSVYRIAAFDINGDGWNDLVLGRGNPAGSNNAGSTEVWMNSGKPNLAMSYPSGKPTVLTPNAATTFNVQLTGLTGGTLQAGSVQIFLSTNGGAFAPANGVHLGGDLYQVAIPGQPCGTSVQWYISASTTSGAVVVDPAAATYNSATPLSKYGAYAAVSTTAALNENFEGAAAGWTVSNDGGLTGGAWELAVPNVTWNEGVKAAPSEDNTAAGTKAFVTGNGAAGGALSAADVDGGSTHLMSPTIDLTGSNADISYAYWYYTSSTLGAGDRLVVSVSNDNGSNWTTVAQHMGPKLADHSDGTHQVNAWKNASFRVGDFVSPTSQVRVRFSVNDLAPASVVEAGLDDVLVTKVVCGGPACTADVTGDLQVNVNDLLAVINAWGTCHSCPADLNDDGLVNVNDLLGVINGWGACP